MTETLETVAITSLGDMLARHEEHTEGTLTCAMEEAKRICRDPCVKGYTNMDELREALLSD